MKVSPLGALAAIVIVGITIEVVEQQSRAAAYMLVALILLGIVTFNAQTFQDQTTKILARLNMSSTARRSARQYKGYGRGGG
jgi:hypothetical protein